MEGRIPAAPACRRGSNPACRSPFETFFLDKETRRPFRPVHFVQRDWPDNAVRLVVGIGNLPPRVVVGIAQPLRTGRIRRSCISASVTASRRARHSLPRRYASMTRTAISSIGSDRFDWPDTSFSGRVPFPAYSVRGSPSSFCRTQPLSAARTLRRSSWLQTGSEADVTDAVDDPDLACPDQEIDSTRVRMHGTPGPGLILQRGARCLAEKGAFRLAWLVSCMRSHVRNIPSGLEAAGFPRWNLPNSHEHRRACSPRAMKREPVVAVGQVR